MANVLCPACGKENPDFLDTCQFCQSSLKPDPMLHIGDKPTKRNTGELEPILPDWLRDVRQQSRDSAEEGELSSDATKPRIPKAEAPDLLAGLASQGNEEEDEIPDWLKSINPVGRSKPAEPPAPEPSSDFFAQFREGQPAAEPPPSQPADEGLTSWGTAMETPQEPAASDEFSDWFKHASDATQEATASQPDLGWMDTFGAPQPAEPSAPAPQEKEDLSWLRDLEASAHQNEAPAAPQEDLGWLNDLGQSAEPAKPAGQEDLSWLDQLGAPAQPAPQEDLSWLSEPGSAPSPSQEQPAEDLSWLNTLGGAPEPAAPVEAAPPASGEDLDWLNQLGQPSEPAGSAQEDLGWLKNFPAAPSAQEPSSAPQDLSWLDQLGGEPEPSEQREQPAPVTSQEDLDWLSSLGASAAEQPQAETPPPASSQPEDDLSWLRGLTSEPSQAAYAKPFGTTEELNSPKPAESETPSPFTPRRTAPLNEENFQEYVPDWLKSATEATPILPLGAGALEQFRDSTPHKPEEQAAPLSTPEPGSAEPAESLPLTNQQVDSLFSMEMPDWLSKPASETGEGASQPAEAPFSSDSLAPVDLPSWVQAMRPVEAVISETPSVQELPTEKEGPLAGLRGVIPFAPIGSARRPKAFSLKLQATEEQQAEALLMDQILTGETAPRAMTSSPALASQRMLRIVLAVLVWVVLGAVILLRSQFVPVSAVPSADMAAASNAIASIPEKSAVLIVVDYEPSLAGEMEAVGAPLLDQLVLSKAPVLAFLSTSPNGVGLADRLLASAGITKPIEQGGLGYAAGQNYVNLGYLPGGSAGVLGFVTQPAEFIRSEALSVTKFSDYAAVLLLTDNTESGRTWVEQLESARQADPALAAQPLVLVTSAQAGPLLQPYVSSKQAAGLVNGLADGARFEYINGSRPGTARTYWDAFNLGIFLALLLILVGSVWSLLSGFRARRTKGEQG